MGIFSKSSKRSFISIVILYSSNFSLQIINKIKYIYINIITCVYIEIPRIRPHSGPTEDRL